MLRAGISPWFQACANSRALKIMLTVGSWSDVFVCACLHNDTYSVKFKWSLAPYRVLIMTLLQWSQNVFNIFPRDAGADLSSRPVLLHSQPTSVFFSLHVWLWTLPQSLPVSMTWVTLINIPSVHMVLLFLKSCATLMWCYLSARKAERREHPANGLLISMSSHRSIILLIYLKVSND